MNPSKVMTYEQFKQRHSASSNWNKLTKKEKKDRYNSYLKSTAGMAVSQSLSPNPGQPKKKLTGPNVGKAAVKSLAKANGFKLSPSTHQYLTALTNPFCPRLQNVGYPKSGGVPSFKFRAFARGEMVIGTLGSGYILADPVNAVASDQVPVSYSADATYAHAGGFPPSAGGVGQANIPLNSPVATTSPLAASTAFRLVAFGIRIRSEAALLSKAGACISTINPIQNSDLLGVATSQCLTDFWKTTKWTPLNTGDSAWHSCIWSPTMPSGPMAGSSAQYGGAADTIYQTLATAPQTQGNYSLGIVVAGAAPGTIFDFEVVGFYELFGGSGLISISATPTYSDPVGTSVIEASTNNIAVNAMSKNEDGAVTAGSIMSSISGAVQQMSKFGQTLTSAISPSVPDVGTTSLDDLEARFAALQMPNVPSSGVAQSGVSFGEEALEGIGDAALALL